MRHEYYCENCRKFFYMDLEDFQYKYLRFGCPNCLCINKYKEVIEGVVENGKRRRGRPKIRVCRSR